MNIQIHGFNADTRTVSVTFTDGEIEHTRDVNACLDDRGGYDDGATSRRVQDVARGVAQKIAVGAIGPAPVEPSPAIDTE